MFWKKSSNVERPSVEWTMLNEEGQLKDIIAESHNQDVLIYKHSTRCGISGMALGRLERGWSEELTDIKTYFLDLIAFRDLSNQVAQTFEVYHESPQVILIRAGKAIYNDSHMGISAEALLSLKK